MSAQPAYEVEPDPPFPSDGNWSSPCFTYRGDGSVEPGPGSYARATRYVLIRPESAPAWVAGFQSEGLGPLSGQHPTPSPQLLCVLLDGTAYVISANAPGASPLAVVPAVRQVLSLEDPTLLLLIGFTDIVAIGGHGIAWRSPRLVDDRLVVAGQVGTTLHCEGVRRGIERVPVVVDLTSGRPV